MDKAKKISKEPAGTKLFSKDSEHIKKMVKKRGVTDKRFDSNSSAIRYYVELGIAAENSPEDAGESLDQMIINSSQKNVLGEELISLTNAVGNLFAAIKTLGVNQADHFTESAAHLNRIEAHLERGIKEISRQLITSLESIYTQLDRGNKTGDETLRNLIVLRSVFYVFLLGHKMGRIEPGKENLVKWDRIISLAHEKANQLSVKEIQLLANDALESTVIQKMAGDIFREVASLPEPATT